MPYRRHNNQKRPDPELQRAQEERQRLRVEDKALSAAHEQQRSMFEASGTTRRVIDLHRQAGVTVPDDATLTMSRKIVTVGEKMIPQAIFDLDYVEAVGNGGDRMTTIETPVYEIDAQTGETTTTEGLIPLDLIAAIKVAAMMDDLQATTIPHMSYDRRTITGMGLPLGHMGVLQA